MNRVNVLMSTYNGSKYIEQQIISILNQKEVEIKLYIREDGSDDKKTEDIIKRIDDERIVFFKGSNLGITQSFFELIRTSDDADYYAFSDQDDFWHENKLISAIKCIQSTEDIPSLYSSNTILVDENLNFLKKQNKIVNNSLGYGIIKNYATGCTILFNHNAKKIFFKSLDFNAPYHDWWLNLIILAIGGVSYFDSNAYIDYRQHGNNIVGGSDSFFKKWKNRFNRFISTKYNRELMAQALLEYYSDYISDKNTKLLELIANYKKNKLNILKNNNFRTDSILDTLLFFISIIFNKI